jgi:hypothetical protein
MTSGSKSMIGEAERRFPLRLRLALPPEGLGSGRDEMIQWLDATCGGRWLGDDADGSAWHRQR